VWRDGNPATMHHKLFVVDGSTVILGSFNFTGSADRSNDENIVVIHDWEVAARYLEEFDRIMMLAR
jgi:phosphatidylserine/phosphatidylglycerophosphate/cardiolipin synthase-like enzyme